MPESIFHRESNDRYVDCGIGRFARGTIMVHILRKAPTILLATAFAVIFSSHEPIRNYQYVDTD